MRVILSRKGFDSTAGGTPSPILPDGRMISLPIPDKRSSILYRDIRGADGDLGQLVSDLTNGRIRTDYRAHLDPDVRHGSIPRLPGWRPLFGQCGPAQGHLRNCGVDAGDIFLFFGLFRRVVVQDGRFAWDKASRPVHVIWGWLQVGSVLAVDQTASVPAWAQYHPHCAMRDERSNTLYTAARKLVLAAGSAMGLPGSGVFSRFSHRLQLTDSDADRHVQWQLPLWMFPENTKPPLTFHSDLRRWSIRGSAALLQSVDRGQEFVLDGRHYPELPAWLTEMIQSDG